MPLRALPLLALALSAPAWAGHPPTGQVLVVNDSGGTVRVELPGAVSQTLRPGERVAFDSRPGDTTVRATYRQFGVTQVLEAERTVVKPHRTSVVVLDPEDDARVLVTNATRFDAELLVDGRYLATLPAGASDVLTVAPGRGSYELVSRSGRFLGATRIDARPFAENAWTVDAPTRGQLVVDSDASFPTRVLVDGRVVATLPAYGDARLDVAVGWHEVELIDERGRLVEETWVEIDPYRVSEIEIDREHRRPSQPVASRPPRDHRY